MVQWPWVPGTILDEAELEKFETLELVDHRSIRSPGEGSTVQLHQQVAYSGDSG